MPRASVKAASIKGKLESVHLHMHVCMRMRQAKYCLHAYEETCQRIAKQCERHNMKVT